MRRTPVVEYLLWSIHWDEVTLGSMYVLMQITYTHKHQYVRSRFVPVNRRSTPYVRFIDTPPQDDPTFAEVVRCVRIKVQKAPKNS